jgi:poly(3-hydroxybutyrate) depolymerase
VYVAGLSSGGTLAATLALREPGVFAAAAIHSSLACGAATDAHDAARAMLEGPRAATDAIALEARAKAADKARVPALVMHGAADASVAPVNSVFLVRQFLLFNGLAPEDLPAGAALPPAQVRPFRARVSDYLAADYHAGRRLAARLVTIPSVGHAWSGGDSKFEFFDGRGLDATALICDFFASHSRK